MSKGSAHLFAGTSGEGKALIQELLSKGIKVSPEKVYNGPFVKTNLQKNNREPNTAKLTQFVA